MQEKRQSPKLKLLSYRQYAGVDSDDPLRFYFWPIIGRLYCRRIELCLAECAGGRRVLEIGFGSGVTFLNLNEIYGEIYGLDLKASVEQVGAVFKARQVETHLQSGSVLSMPYQDDFFDTVLLISVLEHIKPSEQEQAFREIRRVLKPQGQVIYGVPIERRLMQFMFRLLGCDIRQHHFSTEKDVFKAVSGVLDKVRVIRMCGVPSVLGEVYEIGHFIKNRSNR